MISIMLSVVIVLTVVVMITMMMIVMMTTKMVMMVTKGQRHLTQMSREASRSQSVINFAGRPQRWRQKLKRDKSYSEVCRFRIPLSQEALTQTNSNFSFSMSVICSLKHFGWRIQANTKPKSIYAVFRRCVYLRSDCCQTRNNTKTTARILPRGSDKYGSASVVLRYVTILLFCHEVVLSSNRTQERPFFYKMLSTGTALARSNVYWL